MLLPRYIIPFEFDLCFIAGQLLHLIDRKDRETPRRFIARETFSILSCRVYHIIKGQLESTGIYWNQLPNFGTATQRRALECTLNTLLTVQCILSAISSQLWKQMYLSSSSV